MEWLSSANTSNLDRLDPSHFRQLFVNTNCAQTLASSGGLTIKIPLKTRFLWLKCCNVTEH